MIVINSYGLAVFLCILTMLCWGSWANTQKLVKTEWPFQLFYWDFIIGLLLISFVAAITLGSLGSYRLNFFADLTQANWHSLGSTFLSGILFNAANLLLVAGIDIAGMAIAFPIAIGLALVMGVIINYFAIPVGNPWLIFSGTAMILIAMILTSIAYRRVQSNQKSLKTGVLVCLISGIFGGLFFRFLVMDIDPTIYNPVHGLVGPYTAHFVFCVGAMASNFIFTTILMRKPISGPKVSIKPFFKRGAHHLPGILGGALWGLGLVLSLVASRPAGYAIAYGLSQGATLVATLWGVFIWKEFKSASKGTFVIIAVMFAFYLFGILTITLAH